jgi:hypothetical protein
MLPLIRFFRSSSFRTSQYMNEASPGCCAIVLSIAATAAPWASSLQQTTTLAPAFTNSCAHPLPMPLLPPVTITTLSAYRKDVILHSATRRHSPVAKLDVHGQPKAFCNRETDWSSVCSSKKQVLRGRSCCKTRFHTRCSVSSRLFARCECLIRVPQNAKEQPGAEFKCYR